MIKIEHLTKKYGDRYALDDISFEVHPGEVVGFLGPNGAGKSTTMNILTGYLSSTSGKAMIDGMDILEHPLAVKKKIGFLPEQPPLYPEMTVWEYLSFIYDLKKCTLPKKEHLNEICEVIKIADVKDRMIRNLSKGYRQRTGIAGAIVGNPEVVIFDEPTNGLDPKQIVDIRNLIAELGKNHTVILSTHILSEVKTICDRIIIINEGKIIADEKTENIENVIRRNRRISVRVDGPSASVLAALKRINGVRYAKVAANYSDGTASYLIEGDDGLDLRRPVFFALAEGGWPILAMEYLGASIEDLFITVVDEEGATAPDGKKGE